MNNTGPIRELITVFDAKYVRSQVSLIMIGTFMLVVPSILFGGVSFIRAAITVFLIGAAMYLLFVAYTYFRLKPRIKTEGPEGSRTVSARNFGDWRELGRAKDITLRRVERKVGADHIHLETPEETWKSGIRVGSYLFTDEDYKKFAKKWPGPTN